VEVSKVSRKLKALSDSGMRVFAGCYCLTHSFSCSRWRTSTLAAFFVASICRSSSAIHGRPAKAAPQDGISYSDFFRSRRTACSKLEPSSNKLAGSGVLL